MNTPSVLFIDSNGLQLLQARLPQLDVYSENVKALDFISLSPSVYATFDISCRTLIPLPPMEFTRHHLQLAVKEASLQPLMLESGFLSFGSCLLTERNPANEHLRSLTILHRRSLPGLRLPWWPWKPDPWRHVPGSRRSIRPARFLDLSAHVLSSFNNPNWYHWLTLPGLGSLTNVDNLNALIITDCKLAFNNCSPQPLLQRVASLAKVLHPQCKCYFERGPLFLRKLNTCFIENRTSLVCDPSSLQNLRLASASLAALACNVATANKLYLHRGASAKRPLYQEQHLELKLRQRGFHVIDPANLPLPECIAMFSKADLVVAPHGAALTNLVFARPGTKVLELLPGSIEKYGHYALMCAALGLFHNSIMSSIQYSEIFKVNFSQVLSWADEQEC